jgi:hypothetical protein
VRAFLAEVVVDEDARALGREGKRAGSADAARRSRHHHTFAGKPRLDPAYATRVRVHVVSGPE